MDTIAKALIDNSAVKVSIDPPFTWTSGIKSPIYCDNRKMISFPDARNEIIAGFKKMIEEKGITFDVIGGTATAAIPWAAFLAHDLGVPMIYIRPKKKEHGAGKQIEGHLEPGKKVLIVEDLISTGGSSVKASEAVKTEGECTVTDVLAIVTYQFPRATEAFEAASLNAHTLTNFENIITHAGETGYLQQEDVDRVKAFAKNPAEWGATL